MKKKIIILGSSKKFNKLIYGMYSEDVLITVPWRTISYHLKEKQQVFMADLIFVCGYDYSSYWAAMKNYELNNIYAPLAFIEKYLNKEGVVIYIDTEICEKNITLSRYKYAKHKLAEGLAESNILINRIDVPTIVDENSRPLIYGNYLTRKVFGLLIKFKIINFITISDLQDKIKNNSLIKKRSEKNIKGLFLFIRRGLLIDRILRLIYG